MERRVLHAQRQIRRARHAHRSRRSRVARSLRRDALEGKNYVEQYVQTLTHEIKSPLSAIRGAAELLEEEMPREQRSRFVANIRQEADRLHKIAERLLDLSAVEARKALENVAAF